MNRSCSQLGKFGLAGHACGPLYLGLDGCFGADVNRSCSQLGLFGLAGHACGPFYFSVFVAVSCLGCFLGRSCLWHIVFGFGWLLLS